MPRLSQYHNIRYKPLRDLIFRLDTFGDKINVHALQLISYCRNDILDLVRQGQLYNFGENALEERIFGYAPYAESTQKRKKRAGQPANRVTLFKTGRFYRSLRLTIYDDGFEIVSNDHKYKELKSKYGEYIIRLSFYHQQMVVFILRQTFEKMLRDYVKAKTEAEAEARAEQTLREAQAEVEAYGKSMGYTDEWRYAHENEDTEYDQYMVRKAKNIKPNSKWQ